MSWVYIGENNLKTYNIANETFMTGHFHYIYKGDEDWDILKWSNMFKFSVDLKQYTDCKNVNIQWDNSNATPPLLFQNGRC